MIGRVAPLDQTQITLEKSLIRMFGETLLLPGFEPTVNALRGENSPLDGSHTAGIGLRAEEPF